MQDRYGFSYGGYTPADGEWGNMKNINGTIVWSGLVGIFQIVLKLNIQNLKYSSSTFLKNHFGSLFATLNLLSNQALNYQKAAQIHYQKLISAK